MVTAGCGGDASPDSSTPSPSERSANGQRYDQLVKEQKAEEAAARAGRGVLYSVGGSAMYATVTMTTPTGSQQKDVDLPFRGGFRFNFEPGQPVYASVQNQTGFNTVACTIRANGVVVSTNTSDAAYGVATCKGTS